MDVYSAKDFAPPIGNRQVVAKAVPKCREAGARPPAITKRRLSGRARLALRAHPKQGLTRSTSLSECCGSREHIGDDSCQEDDV